MSGYSLQFGRSDERIGTQCVRLVVYGHRVFPGALCVIVWAEANFFLRPMKSRVVVCVEMFLRRRRGRVGYRPSVLCLSMEYRRGVVCTCPASWAGAQ